MIAVKTLSCLYYLCWLCVCSTWLLPHCSNRGPVVKEQLQFEIPCSCDRAQNQKRLKQTNDVIHPSLSTVCVQMPYIIPTHILLTKTINTPKLSNGSRKVYAIDHLQGGWKNHKSKEHCNIILLWGKESVSVTIMQISTKREETIPPRPVQTHRNRHILQSMFIISTHNSFSRTTINGITECLINCHGIPFKIPLIKKHMLQQCKDSTENS